MDKIRTRYIQKPVEDDLKHKMVFIGGPRQVGKTTFGQTFLEPPYEKQRAYLNWDSVSIRPSLLI